MFGHNDHRYIWRIKGGNLQVILSVKYGGGSIMLWGCLAAGGTGAFHNIDGIMRNENYVQVKA